MEKWPKGLSALAQGLYLNIQTSSSPTLLDKSKPNFIWSFLLKGVGTKVYINFAGHMTKIKNLLLQNQKVYDFETWLEAWGNGGIQSLYKS